MTPAAAICHYNLGTFHPPTNTQLSSAGNLKLCRLAANPLPAVTLTVTNTVGGCNRNLDSRNSKYFVQLPLLRFVYGLNAPFIACGSNTAHAAAFLRQDHCRMA